MPRTDIVTVYRAKGNSETLAVVIPKSVWKEGSFQKGDRLQASVDYRGRIVYKRIGRALENE